MWHDPGLKRTMTGDDSHGPRGPSRSRRSCRRPHRTGLLLDWLAWQAMPPYRPSEILPAAWIGMCPGALRLQKIGLVGAKDRAQSRRAAVGDHQVAVEAVLDEIVEADVLRVLRDDLAVEHNRPSPLH